LYSCGVSNGGTVKKLAAVAGGSLSVVGTGVGVIVAEAQIARRQIGNAEGEPPAPSGWYGQGRPGPALKIAIIGDSSAAGYGVDAVEDTPGAYIASAVAEAADRRVYLSAVAKVGAQTKDLAGQVDLVLPVEPHVAVIFIGANDVTHAVPLRTSIRLLTAQMRRLRAAGVEVVMATCPDLGSIEPLAPPLKQVARFLSRRLATAQATATLESGGRSVALASILGSEFQRLSDLLFGPDRFHPSAAGYVRMCSAVLPTILAALEAARLPGASLEPVEEGQPDGVRGRFVQLRRRRRRPDTDVETPQSSEAGVEGDEPAPAGSGGTPA
jgi:lysophospholipase L1-like esterase